MYVCMYVCMYVYIYIYIYIYIHMYYIAGRQGQRRRRWRRQRPGPRQRERERERPICSNGRRHTERRVREMCPESFKINGCVLHDLRHPLIMGSVGDTLRSPHRSRTVTARSRLAPRRINKQQRITTYNTQTTRKHKDNIQNRQNK